MAQSFEQYQRKRLLSSYFSVVFSIFLVLFLVGILGLFIINSKKISNDFKENIPMSVYFKDEANDTVLKQFDSILKASKFVKKYKLVTKEEAAVNNPDIVGKDFMEFLGFNPLQNSFDVTLKENFVNLKEIRKIESSFKSNVMVTDVIYDKQLVGMVNEKVATVTMWVLGISSVLAIIAMLLINSSIRLSIYSHRFTIKTMQMVGATKSFIRKPFILKSIYLGLIGAALAIIALLFVVFWVDGLLPTLGIAKDYFSFGMVAIIVLLVGIIITGLSTYFATTRFLNLKTDSLY